MDLSWNHSLDVLFDSVGQGVAPVYCRRVHGLGQLRGGRGKGVLWGRQKILLTDSCIDS